MSDATRRSIAVATITLVRDAGEEPLLRRSMTALARHGYPVFVADGGSGDGFVSFLQSLDGVRMVDPAGRGLVNQVRASVTASMQSGAAFVLYTEPDKQEFFERGLDRFVARAPLDRAAGAVLAARSAAAFETFPAMQRSAERTINDLCGSFLGVHGDYSYGPFLLDAPLAADLASVSDDAGWGWRHFMFAVAHRRGRALVLLAGDHACPDDQRTEDDRERIHRLRQLGQNVNGLLAGLTAPLRDLPSAGR